MSNEETALAIEAMLKQHRGGCMCGSREVCERCSFYGPFAKMEDDLRALCRVLRGQPEPPPPDYGASIAITL